MTASEPSTLSEAFPDYPGTHPQTLVDLLNADPDTITSPLAWLLRRQVTEAVRSSERVHIRGPKHVMQLLLNGARPKEGNLGSLHAWDGAWVSYALTADRQVLLVPDGKGGMRSMRKATRLLPKKDDLPDLPASAHRGTGKPAWLIIYGGSPEVLDKEHVAQGLATLARRVPVADICFWQEEPDNGSAPTLWSVRAGVGVTSSGGGTAVEFPNPDKLTEVKL